MFDLNVPKLTKLIEERFGGKDPSVVQNALNCFNGGYGHQIQGSWSRSISSMPSTPARRRW